MFFCGVCGQKQRMENSRPGGAGRCEGCNSLIPNPSGEMTAAEFFMFCPGCQARLHAPTTLAGKALACPRCKTRVQLPDLAIEIEEKQPIEEPMPVAEPIPEAVETGGNPPPPNDDLLVCPICQTPIGPDEPEYHCRSCQTVYHQDCWEENRGCAMYGCPEVPETQHLSSVEVPVSFWGRETKPCPVCRKEILAAAVRCRHCGTVFETSRPMDTQEYASSKAREEKSPGLRRRVTLLFIFCLIPCTAPFAFLFGIFWFRANRGNIKALPSVYDGLGKLGLVVAAGQTLFSVAMMLLHGLLNT